MKNKLKIAIVGAGLAAVGATGVGTAFAASSVPSAPSSVQATSPVDGADTAGGPDIQQGDQTSPDTASTATDATATDATGGESAEAPGSENSAVSDGPGGHADPAGSNTDNQQQGNN